MSEKPALIFTKTTEVVEDIYQPTKSISALYHLLLNDKLDPQMPVTFKNTDLDSLIETLGSDATKLYRELISPEHKHVFKTVHQLRQLFLTLLTSYNVDPVSGMANLNLQGLLTGTKRQPNELDTASYTALMNPLSHLLTKAESNPAFKQKRPKNPHPMFTNMQYQSAFSLFVQENNTVKDVETNTPKSHPTLLSPMQRNQFAVDEYVARHLAYCTFKDNDIVRVHQYDHLGECKPALYRVKNIITREKGVKGIALIPASPTDDSTIHIAFPGVNLQNPETLSVAVAPASAPGHQTYKKVEGDILQAVNQIVGDFQSTRNHQSTQVKSHQTQAPPLRLNVVGHSLGGALAQKIFTSLLFAEEANCSPTDRVLHPADSPLDDESLQKLNKSRAHHNVKRYEHIHSRNISGLNLSSFATAGLTRGSASRADYLLRAMDARVSSKPKININHFKSSHDPVNASGSSVIGFGMGIPKSANSNISAHSYTIQEHNLGPKHNAIDAHSVPFFARESPLSLTKHRSNEPEDIESTKIARKLTGFIKGRQSI